MADCEKILIAGFSGSGKSSLLKELKRSAPPGGLHFDDLDELVLMKLPQSTLSEFIRVEGWEKFRQLERESLWKWLQQEGKGVLALGGGTLTWEILKDLRSLPQVKLVYLSADFKSCWERLTTFPGEERPLVKSGEAAMQKLYQERCQIFSQITLRLENPPGPDLSHLAQHFWELIRRS